MSEQQGKLIIISGPSGVGKSTVVARLIEQCPLPLKLSVSATTRPARPEDRPGENYIFLSEAEFRQKVANGEFLEYVEVFGRGHWYGTLREPVSSGLKQANWIILEIDVEGAAKVKQNFPDAISIFIHPGSLEELERRLRGRATEKEADLERRLEVASEELEAAIVYDHIVTNHTVDQTVGDICQLLAKESDSPIEN